jgi:hypothetical protein
MAGFVAFLGVWLAASGMPHAQRPADLLAAARTTGSVLAFENDYVRVRYEGLEYPAAERAVAESRPLVLYVRVRADSNAGGTALLDAPRGGRLSWRAGAVPRGVVIDILKPPPTVSSLRDPEADPPPGWVQEMEWEGGRLLVAIFEPMHFGYGTGSSPSVTTFLSDGVVDVSNRGVRRRMGVSAGDAFWFEARTSLRVVSDDPVGAAIAQIDSRQGRPGGPF